MMLEEKYSLIAQISGKKIVHCSIIDDNSSKRAKEAIFFELNELFIAQVTLSIRHL